MPTTDTFTPKPFGEDRTPTEDATEAIHDAVREAFFWDITQVAPDAFEVVTGDAPRRRFRITVAEVTD